MWKIIDSFDAVGGPEQTVKEGKHTRGPTRPGRFTLTPKDQFVSTIWEYSRIRWGTPIRWDFVKDDVLFSEGGRWHSVRQRVFNGSTARVIETLQSSLRNYGAKGNETPNTWVFNDFGHVTYYLFEDRDGDGTLDHGEWKIDDFLHTTPDNEYQTAHGLPVVLLESHGCVHIKPNTIDEMARKGYLRGGVHFIVHKFGEWPPGQIAPMKGSRRFELHFFPSARKIYVYG